MHLLLFGASGQAGQELLRQAIQRSHSVTAFVRQPAKLVVTAPGIRVVEGDVADFDAVTAAIPQHDAVVSTLGVSTPLHHDPAVVAGVQNIVQAMQEHRVPRLIYLSFIGVHESRSAVGAVLRYLAPILLRHEIADHEAKEAVIRSSDLDWTIVRPPKLTNGPLTGRYRSGEPITTSKPVPLLSRADLAHFVLQELAEPAFVRRAPRLLH